MKIAEAPQEGVFVKELEQALLEDRAEIAVHSAKDLPTTPTPGLVLAAFLPRADAHDVLVGGTQARLTALPHGARVGTGSPRRSAQLLAARPDLRIEPIRGNVDTRLRKLRAGEVDALVLAAAGLIRLGHVDEATEVLPLDVMVPAPGQGAIALQVRTDAEVRPLVAAVDDRPTRRAVEAERAVLRGLGGGCQSAIGVHAWSEGLELVVQAAVLAPDGQRTLKANASGPNDATVVADVISGLLAQGANYLLHTAGDDRPLQGLRIMVTRPVEQAGSLVHALQEAGAIPVLCPMIAIETLPVPNGLADRLETYDWIVFTSVNGVERFMEILRAAGSRIPPGVRVAAIGPETAGRLQSYGLAADVVPERYVAEDLADSLPESVVRGKRVLLPRAAGSRTLLQERLAADGASVDVIETYRSITPANLPARLHRHLDRGLDLITFTSSSTVRNFVQALGGPLKSEVEVACIGPVTAEAARRAGLRVDIIADEYTARGLLEAIVRHRRTATLT